jgi:hypothetical protein
MSSSFSGLDPDGGQTLSFSKCIIGITGPRAILLYFGCVPVGAMWRTNLRRSRVSGCVTFFTRADLAFVTHAAVLVYEASLYSIRRLGSSEVNIADTNLSSARHCVWFVSANRICVWRRDRDM